MILATQLRRRASALIPYGSRLSTAAGYAVLAITCAAITVGLIGPAAAATAAMAVAVFALAVVFHVVPRRYALPEIVPQEVAVSADADFEAAPKTGDDNAAEMVGAEILSNIERARDEKCADRNVSPAITDGVAGKPAADETASRWVSLSTAAQIARHDRQAVYRAVREGQVRRRLARDGRWLVDLDDVRRLASSKASPPLTTVTAADRSEAQRIERVIVEAMTAGRVEMELTTIATLPTRKIGMIDSRLVLSDATEQPIDVPASLSDKVRLQLDLLAIAFAGATLRQCGTAGQAMFVHLAAATVGNAEFRSELEAAFDDEPSLSSRLVVVLPLKAYAELQVGAAVDDLMARGLRFAANAQTLPVSVANTFLASCPPVSFIQLSADALIEVPEQAAAIAARSLAPVAMGVTTEKQVVEILDLGLPLAGGPLFAVPKRAPVHLPALALAA